MDVLRGFAWLLLCQSAGELIVRGLHLRLPGPVAGMLILLGLLQAGFVRRPVAAAADALLAHLSLLFVPIGVGVMTHVGLVTPFGLQLMVVLLVSTLAGMAAAALVLQRLWPRAG